MTEIIIIIIITIIIIIINIIIIIINIIIIIIIYIIIIIITRLASSAVRKAVRKSHLRFGCNLLAETKLSFPHHISQGS